MSFCAVYHLIRNLNHHNDRGGKCCTKSALIKLFVLFLSTQIAVVSSLLIFYWFFTCFRRGVLCTWLFIYYATCRHLFPSKMLIFIRIDWENNLRTNTRKTMREFSFAIKLRGFSCDREHFDSFFFSWQIKMFHTTFSFPVEQEPQA